MRFLLRCIFWLSIVYASILTNARGQITTSMRGDIAATARTAIAVPVNALATRATAGLSTYCGRDPDACLADSARLTALVTASGEDDAGGNEAAAAPRRPDPRHRARGAPQARMP